MTMLKALFRKQMLEIGAQFLRDRKTGAVRKGKSAAGILAVLGLAFVSVAFIFFTLADSLAEQLVPLGYGQLYFAMMALIAVAFGVFGSVFNTYAGLYQAKDNELLLSMPVPPAKILLARLCSVSFMGLLYESLVWLPAVIVHHLTAGFSPVRLILQLAAGAFLAMLVVALTCFLGWIVALISSRLKNKSFITVLISLVLIAGYYVLYGNAYRILASILANTEAVESGVRSWAYPFWAAGGAAAGEALSLLPFALIAVFCLLVTWFVLERSFLRIATANRGSAKRVYREKAARQGSVRSALFKKEMRRFTASATYMLNCGLGTVFLLAAAVVLAIYAGKIRSGLDMFRDSADFQAVLPFLPHIAAGMLCLCSTMNDITAPSVSMEGKSLWILQSSPVRPWDVLRAKLELHIVLTLVPEILAGIVSCAVLGLSLPASLLVLAVCAAFTVFCAAAGLCLNLRSPNLDWTNETMPLKNSMPVFVMIFGSWGVVLALGALVLALSLVMPPLAGLAAAALIPALGAVLLLLWLKRRGSEIFASLG